MKAINYCTILQYASKNQVIFRSLSLCNTLCKETHNKLKLKGRKSSSQQWLSRQLADPYVRWAQVDQYRCRSAFKLLEIDERLKFLSPGMFVVDCGAAPGSWSQVLVKKCNSAGQDQQKPQGLVIAVDRNNFLPIDGASILSGCDFTEGNTQNKIKSLLEGKGGAHAVVSDMAPLATGMKHMDHEVIINLSYIALRFSIQVSRPGASFLTKLWDGRLAQTFQTDVSKFYEKVKVIKPNSSRSDSAEMFVFANKFKGLK